MMSASRIERFLKRFSFASYNDVTSKLELSGMSYCTVHSKLYFNGNLYKFPFEWFNIGCSNLELFENDLNIILEAKRILEENGIIVRFNFCQNSFHCIYKEIEYCVCFRKNTMIDSFGNRLSVDDMLRVLLDNKVPTGQAIYYCEPLLSTSREVISGWEDYLYLS